MSILEELTQYSNDVISGKITACKKHKWSCMRFLRDIEKQGTEEFPYVFDEAKALRFFNWMRLFKHTKGILKGQKIEPHIIQKFVFGNVYGWINKETGYRRFRKFYWQVARKNAKSQSLACVGTYETIVTGQGEEANEVYCAATKRDQAKVIYDEACTMLRKCNLLKGKYNISYGRIVHPKSGSFMRALSEEDKKTGDGLNPQCGIIDEYHAHETSEMYDIIATGMGARSQPLLGIITTAGLYLENPCYRVEYELVSKILNPDISFEIDSYFVMVNELEKNETPDDIMIGDKKVKPGELVDDIGDELTWEKANPIICSYSEGKAGLRDELKEALEMPEKMRNFLTKRMNVWVNMRENAYMNMEKWSLCKGDIPELKGESCWIGIDLSSKLDLTSVIFEFHVHEKWYLLHHSFIPLQTMQQKIKTDKMPYDVWVKQGYITATDGNVVDYEAVRDYIIKTIEERGYLVNEDCLDPWGSAKISNDLQEEGHTVVEIIQGLKTLSEPTKHFREMVYSRRIVHDGDPVLTWAMSNAVIRQDHNLNFMLDKSKSKNRIDPAAAAMNAHTRAMLTPDSGNPKVLFV